MVFATVQQASLSHRDIIISHFASAVYSKNDDQLRAACKELVENYDQGEIRNIWKEIGVDFTTEQKMWLWKRFKSLVGESGGTTALLPAQPLTSQEQKQLKKHETEIEEGIKSYVRTGEALKKILEGKLYREHGTFEEYVEERWDFKGRTVYQYIKSAEVAEEVCSIVHILPANESVARELAKVKDSEERVKVWQQITAINTEPKAREVREVVEKLNSKTQPASPPEEDRIQVLFGEGKLVTINCKSGAESRFDGFWGKIIHVAANGRYRVVTAGTTAVFEPSEIEECELVSEVIANRIEALTKQESNGHIADLAATYYMHNRFEPWQIDLLGFLEGKV